MLMLIRKKLNLMHFCCCCKNAIFSMILLTPQLGLATAFDVVGFARGQTCALLKQRKKNLSMRRYSKTSENAYQ